MALVEALRRVQPEIVHFICHGTEEGLILEDEFGESSLVEAEWLVHVFAVHCPSARLVLLNVCKSAALAAALVESHRPSRRPTDSPRTTILGAIAWRDRIRIDHARAFSSRFYASLAPGVSVGEAFLAAGHSLEDESGRLVRIALRNEQNSCCASSRRRRRLRHPARSARNLSTPRPSS
ncbi:CHAT domain-containing protein [Nannocystis sp.]|uniref:CHAT domain-containing protein n=1 Tax=Nannocystis sp. TaxID=1962667 RepID=UPI0025E96D62|nr:CHAT domain-containing protein [Nannocystis sp.]MBK7829748.1 CHAT domain-containing protein [Nannocystis sp.]